MKILILTDAFPPEDNAGAEQMSFRLAQKYQEAGHLVTILTTTRKKEAVGEDNYQGLRVIRVYCQFIRRLQAYRAIYNFSTTNFLRKFLRKENFDIVHAHNVHMAFSYRGLKVIKKFRMPLILTLHDCQTVCYKKFDCFYRREDLNNPPTADYKIDNWKCFKCQKKRFFPLRNFLIRRILNKIPDRVIAVSWELKQLLEINGIKANGVIHNGLAFKDFAVGDEKVKNFKEKYSLAGRRVVLFGGRISEAKGGRQLVETMKLVSEKESKAILLILTNKDDKCSIFLKARAEELGIEILISGWLSGEDLIAAYHSADLVVTPSICFDTFGLMNIEAMVCRKPVITSCFGGGKEIVADGESGYVVNPFNIKNFSDKILEILTREDLAKKMGERGREIVREKFTMEKAINDYLEIVKDLTIKK